MKKKKINKLVVFLVLLIAIIAYLLINNLNKPKEIIKSSDITVKNETVLKQKNLEISDIVLDTDGNLTNISANVKNNDNKKYDLVSLDVIFYDKDNKEIVRGKGLIENINVSETKGFKLSITGDYTKESNYKIEIVNLK